MLRWARLDTTPDKVIDGKYRVIRSIGEGGMGMVYLVEHLFLRRQLALKLLRPEMTVYAEAAVRFEREARATSAIEHENVVRVTDFGQTSERELYLVMELLEGRSLAAELQGTTRLSPTRAIYVATQILRGLEAAHALGVVHRDLKPENVFMVARRDGTHTIKIVDFGLAMLRQEGDLRLTTTGAVMGTPLYMAPEQARGEPDIDARTDLHAVGIILYEMLSGRLPYGGETFAMLAHAILDGRPPVLALVEPDIDPVLSALVMKAIASERTARFQTATEMREALERHTLPAPSAGAPSPWDSPREDQLASLPPGRDATTLGKPARPGPPTLEPSTASVAPVPLRKSATLQPRVLEPEADDAPLELDRPAPPAPAPAEPSPARAPWLAALALLLVVGAGGGWWLTHRTAPPPARVHIQIVDLPAGARVFLDGERVQAALDVPGSTAPRQLRIEAHGHATRLLLLTPDSDQVLDGRLDRSK